MLKIAGSPLRLVQALALCAVTMALPAVCIGQEREVSWSNILRQEAQWYGSAEALRIADNVLLWQRDNGGWIKANMIAPLDEAAKEKLIADKSRTEGSFDNGMTHTQMRFLAKVFKATGRKDCTEAFNRGLDYIFAAQYPNGGWPQWFPPRKGRTVAYSGFITYNDGAMIGVLQILRDIVNGSEDFSFVDDARRKRAAAAVENGIKCILETQIVVDGKKTGWCAQHDHVTLQPALARSYELPSLSGGESVGIVEFLMATENPSPEVVKAVESAVEWFEKVKIEGVRSEYVPNPQAVRGRDVVHVEDPAAPAMWARFYEIGTDRPIYMDRDGIPKYSLAEIGIERRSGYRWTGNWPQRVLDAYPAWKAKYNPPK